jgi:hypothetical protein
MSRHDQRPVPLRIAGQLAQGSDAGAAYTNSGI